MNSGLISTIFFIVGAPTMLATAAFLPLPQGTIATDSSSAMLADQSFLKAITSKDRPAVERLLLPDFSWIDSHGQRFARGEVLERFPVPTNADVGTQERVYGTVAVLRADRGKVHALRVWTNGSSGWHLLLNQEVTQVEKSEPTSAAASGECVNPCQTIPYQPQTQSEKDAIASWQRVMRAMAENDAEAYAPLIADEFTAIDTHHDWPYTKADRLAQIRKQKANGTRTAPPEMVSAQMFDFGDTVMMIAREQRKPANAFFNTRMWLKRDGRWQMLFSFNTRIQ
jgi:ketosteroid isomerase-like protein